MKKLEYLHCFAAKLTCALRMIATQFEEYCLKFQEENPTWNPNKIAEHVCDAFITWWMEHTRWDSSTGAVVTEAR